MDLPLLTASFAALALVFYVVLDGFDLGVGILLSFRREQASRDHMVDSITPTWDGNETWLIMAGVSLLAAFPIAYAILMPAFYLPIILMLLGLGLRGVSFEFRIQMKSHRQSWDYVFACGSVIAAVMQGVIVGGLMQGVEVRDRQFSGSVFDAFRPLPLLCGLAVATGYCVLGAGWLFLKSNQLLLRFAVRILRIATGAFVSVFFVACLAAVRAQPAIRAAWASHYLPLSMVTALFVVLLIFLGSTSANTPPLRPLLAGTGLFLLGMAGIVVIIYPNIIPFQLTLWDAAASSTSQKFVLIGIACVAPVVLAYSSFAYWVFRGRTPAKGWSE
jgi:cytochrome d ubiquinol oxidase subunit II